MAPDTAATGCYSCGTTFRECQSPRGICCAACSHIVPRTPMISAAGMEPAPDTSWVKTVEIKDYDKQSADDMRPVPVRLLDAIAKGIADDEAVGEPICCTAAAARELIAWVKSTEPMDGAGSMTEPAPLTTEERNAQEAVREKGLCGAVGNGRVCIRDPHDGLHGFETVDVVEPNQPVVEAAERLRTTFDWIDIGSGDPADLRVIAAVALGVTPAQADVEQCMGLGWIDD